MAPQHIVIHLEIPLAILQAACRGAASDKRARNLQACCARERNIGGALPGKSDVGFVQKARAQGEDIGEPQVLLAHRAAVTSFRQDKTATAYVV